MTKTITQARQVRIDPRTDVREYVGDPLGAHGIAALNGEEFSLAPGLWGWPPYTHTAAAADGTTYHVSLAQIDVVRRTGYAAFDCTVCGHADDDDFLLTIIPMVAVGLDADAFAKQINFCRACMQRLMAACAAALDATIT